MEWLPTRVPQNEKGQAMWVKFMHDLHTPPPRAFRDPRVRALARESYRQFRAAAEQNQD